MRPAFVFVNYHDITKKYAPHCSLGLVWFGLKIALFPSLSHCSPFVFFFFIHPLLYRVIEIYCALEIRTRFTLSRNANGAGRGGAGRWRAAHRLCLLEAERTGDFMRRDLRTSAKRCVCTYCT